MRCTRAISSRNATRLQAGHRPQDQSRHQDHRDLSQLYKFALWGVEVFEQMDIARKWGIRMYNVLCS
jgi:hypothetical protein